MRAMTMRSADTEMGTAVLNEARKRTKTGIIAAKNKMPRALLSIAKSAGLSAYAASIPVQGRNTKDRPAIKPPRVPAAVAKKVFPSAKENMLAVSTPTPPRGKPTLRKICGLARPRAFTKTRPRVSNDAPTPIANKGYGLERWYEHRLEGQRGICERSLADPTVVDRQTLLLTVHFMAAASVYLCKVVSTSLYMLGCMRIRLEAELF